MLAVAHSLAMLFAARIVDGLSGGNITTARAYIADISTEENRAKVVRHAGRRLRPRLHRRAGAGRAVLTHQLHRADLGGRGDHRGRDSAGVGVAAGNRAPRARRWPARPGRRCASWAAAASLRLLFTVDFVYWTAFAVYQTTFALFGARRFGFDAAHTGYLLSAFGFLGVLVQGVLVGQVVARFGARPTLALGLLCAAVGWGGSALTYSLPVFVADAGARRARHRPVQRDAQHAHQQRRRRRTSRGACRAPPARSKASAGRSARSGATARCSCSARARRTDPRRSSCSARRC